MKKIFLKKDNIVFCLRGVPGSGKSTWLQEQGLLDYTISPDSFRLMLSNPVYNQETQQEEINQAVSGKAWEMTYDCLKSRCRYGGVTFVDATFMHPKALASLKEVVPQNYKIVAQLKNLKFPKVCIHIKFYTNITSSITNSSTIS